MLVLEQHWRSRRSAISCCYQLLAVISVERGGLGRLRHGGLGRLRHDRDR
jgi:hypothetical protein